MSRGVVPGTLCNLACSYCYENESREVNGPMVTYDIEEIMDSLETWKDNWAQQDPPGIHGGEPTLMKNEDMERIFAYIDHHWEGQPWIQTNGTNIDDELLAILKRYNVYVGVSCDGPPELNTERIAKSGETEKMSERTVETIHQLDDAGLGGNVIIVLHETNVGTDEKLETLLDWMDELMAKGIGGHYNPLGEGGVGDTSMSLDPERLGEVYIKTWEWMKDEQYRRTWGPISDFVDMLLGLSGGSCRYGKCSPSGTAPAINIAPDGEFGSCARVWSVYGSGEQFLAGPSNDSEYTDGGPRYDMLEEKPGPYTDGAPDLGGCKGCPYWNICTGGCPAAGMDNDWRNRTHMCKSNRMIFEHLESDIRALFPDANLITDEEWNADIYDDIRNWQHDGKPWASYQ